jgi:hypothetical protein
MATQIPKWATTLNDDDWKLVAWAVETLEDNVQQNGDDFDWSDDDEHGRTVERLSSMVRAIWAEEKGGQQ